MPVALRQAQGERVVESNSGVSICNWSIKGCTTDIFHAAIQAPKLSNPKDFRSYLYTSSSMCSDKSFFLCFLLRRSASERSSARIVWCLMRRQNIRRSARPPFACRFSGVSVKLVGGSCRACCLIVGVDTGCSKTFLTFFISDSLLISPLSSNSPAGMGGGKLGTNCTMCYALSF